MQVSAAEFSKMQLAILYEFIQEHTDIRQTNANGRALGAYLAENGLPVSWKNLSVAYTNLKAAGKLELAKSPEEIQKEQIETARKIILQDVAARIAPAKIDFTNSSIMAKISSYLHTHEKGLMSTDRVLRAIEAHKFDEGFWQVPPADLYKSQDYVHGMRNHAKDAKPSEETEHGPFGRRNHALDDVTNKELKEGFKKVRKGMDEEEGRRIGAVMDHAIDSYVAVRNGRISVSQTEAVKAALRKYMEKHGSAVLSLIREMPDNDSTEWYIKKRI